MTSEDTTEAGSVYHFNAARPRDCNTEQGEEEVEEEDEEKPVWMIQVAFV